MRTKTPLYRTVEQVLGGDLEQWLRERKDVGEGWAVASKMLFAEHGIDVSQQTLRLWARSLGIEKGAA